MTGNNRNENIDLNLNRSPTVNENLYDKIVNQNLEFTQDEAPYFSVNNHFDPLLNCTKWLDSNKVNRSDKKRSEEYFKMGKKDKPNLTKIGNISICGLNIPHYKNSDSDILKELTIIRPDIDIWVLSELYSKSDILFPAGYAGFTSKNGNIKTTAIMVKEEVQKWCNQIESKMNETILEVNLGPKLNQKITLFAVYRSPSKVSENSSFARDLGIRSDEEILSFYLNILEKISENENWYLMGDINWATCKKFAKNRTLERQFIEGFKKVNCKNIFGNKITYNPQDGRKFKPTSIDAFIANTNEKNIISSSVIESDFHEISDHFGIIVIMRCQRKFKKPKTEWVKKRIDRNDKALQERINFYSKLSINKFKLKDAFENFKFYDNKNNVCQRILDAISWINEMSVEKIKVKTRNKNPCLILSKKYYNMMKEKRKRYSFLSQTDRNRIKSDKKLKKLKREIQKEYRMCVRKSWSKKAEEKLASNELNWNFFKRFKNESVDIPENLTADNFAERFQELSYDYNKIQKDHKRNVQKISNFSFQYKIDVTSKNYGKNIHDIIMKCSNSANSSGWDGINLNFLRMLNIEMHKTIAYLIGCCIKSGCYMKSFRDIKSMPVFKKGNPQILKNWRPISVANWACNLLEKVMCIQMTEFWEKKNLLNWRQFGFRGNHSVGQLINSLKKEFYKRNEKYGMVLMTDLSNAFGSADTWIIIERMRPYMKESALKLLKSFLIQGEVRVKIGDDISRPFFNADRGYSQGSNLSTFLFIILMSLSHNLPDDTQGFSFADDKSILSTSNNLTDFVEKSNRALNGFHDFCKSHNIRLNCEKTFYTLIGDFKTADINKIILKTDNKIIKRTDTMNCLGIEIDKKLDEKVNFRNVERAINNKMRYIRSFGKFCKLHFSTNMIKGFCLGKFQHGIPYQQIRESQDYNKMNKPIFEFLRLKSCTQNERRNESYKRLSQAEVYKRSHMISFLNAHRMAQMCRLNKILLTMQPKWEVIEVLKCLSKNSIKNWRGDRNGIKFINSNQLNPEYAKVAPGIWLDEFNALPKNLRNLIGTKKFETEIKNFYKFRCQHQENTNKRCENCGESTFNYKKRLNFSHTIRNTRNQILNSIDKEYEIDELMDIIKQCKITHKGTRIEKSTNEYFDFKFNLWKNKEKEYF